MKMNHYETLGVTESATPEEIKKAYRKLASQHHPDKGGDTATFQSIQTAYDTLSDPNKKQQYDLERQGGGNWQRFNFHDFGGQSQMDINDIFAQFGFGQGGAGSRYQPRRNKDLRITIPFSLHESLAEQKKTVSVQTTNGQRQTLEITIPRGITGGASMKYPGLGDNFFTSLPRGDLYVHFEQLRDPKFQAMDIDLFTRIEINCLDAITGGETEVPGVDGKTFLLTIPPGTQHSTKFRIKGEGLYELNQDYRGNLIVEINISVPKNLTEQQLDLIKQVQSNQ
jgi:curved DNA-binding protein